MRLILTTIDTREGAEKLGRSLVERKLAACVNIIPGVSSIYRWDGDVQQADEWLLVIKTSVEGVDRLERQLREDHPYDLPEIVVLSPDHVSQEYREWVRSSTRDS